MVFGAMLTLVKVKNRFNLAIPYKTKKKKENIIIDDTDKEKYSL
jgi:hypothetical protein